MGEDIKILTKRFSNGKFTMKTAYFLPRIGGEINGQESSGSSVTHEVKFLWKALWRARVLKKVKICVEVLHECVTNTGQFENKENQ